MQTAPAERASPYAAFLDVLTSALAQRATDACLGLLLVHIEGFWRLVGADGFHAASRHMLELETALRAGLRHKDVLMRLGDDKFAAIIGGVLNEGHLSLAASKIARIVHERAPLAVRIGMALCPTHASDADGLLRAAETALLAAEDDGEAQCLYDTAGERRLSDQWAMGLELDDAIENNGLDVYYQPKVSAADHRPLGAEALLRWHSPTRGQISPDVFVRLADETGRIDQLTWYVMNIATRTCVSWPNRIGEAIVAVNVTPNVIEFCDLPRLVSNAIGLWNLPPERLVIELTESALMGNPRKSTAILTELRESGVKVAIDDFGTGYSSLSYFRNIPADELKIDKSFVFDMLTDKVNKTLVRAIIRLAHDFGLSVTAEGVENQETAELLAALGCDCLQGFHFSKPLPSGDFANWLNCLRASNR